MKYLILVENYFLLLALHCLADYPLQGDFLASFKGKNKICMFVHCVIWSGLIYFGLKHLGIAQYWHIPFLFLGHMLIDCWKCSRSGNGKELTTDLLVDQFLHLIQIIACMHLR